jgi:glutathione S-transferase
VTSLRDPILYSFRRCPYAMRARLALTVAGVRCELREIRLRAKPPSMLAASPKGTVPVLVLTGGAVLDESLDIMRSALEQRDPEGWLRHDDAALIAMNDGTFKQDLDRYKYPERYNTDPIPHRDRALDFLHAIDARIAENGQLCGPTRGLADAAIMPFVRQFAAVDRQWFEGQPLPALQGWLNAHLDSDLFHAVMVPVTPWADNDSPIFLPLLDSVPRDRGRHILAD